MKIQLFCSESEWEENMQEILNWIQGHLPLAIAMAVAVVLLIVIIVALVVSSKRKKKDANNVRKEDSDFVRMTEETSDAERAEETEKTERLVERTEAEESIAEPYIEAAVPSENTAPEQTEENVGEHKEDPTIEDETRPDIKTEEVVPAAEEGENPEPEVVSNPESEKPKAEKKPIVQIVGTAKTAKKRTPPTKKTVKAEKKTEDIEADEEILDGIEVSKKVGKWTVETRGKGEYVAKLTASNGEVMLSSEAYSTENGARGGIATIIKTVATGKFVVYRDKNDNCYFKLKTAANRLLCMGGIYKTKDQCERAVESVKRIAPAAVVYDMLVEGAKYEEYVPAKVNYAVAKGGKGKWKLEMTADGKFTAKLYASNGQLMLATEEVSTKKTVSNIVDAVGKNAAAGNFVIDRDKFGRYYYKLRNAQKSVICIGESYESLDSCVNAIESVRRYAATASVPAELL